jgi:hypothetical protein
MTTTSHARLARSCRSVCRQWAFARGLPLFNLGPDHDLLQQQLAAAGLSKKYDRFQSQVKAELEKEWPLLEMIVAFLLEKVTASGPEVREFIKQADK